MAGWCHHWVMLLSLNILEAATWISLWPSAPSIHRCCIPYTRNEQDKTELNLAQCHWNDKELCLIKRRGIAGGDLCYDKLPQCSWERQTEKARDKVVRPPQRPQKGHGSEMMDIPVGAKNERARERSWQVNPYNTAESL